MALIQKGETMKKHIPFIFDLAVGCAITLAVFSLLFGNGCAASKKASEVKQVSSITNAHTLEEGQTK